MSKFKALKKIIAPFLPQTSIKRIEHLENLTRYVHLPALHVHPRVFTKYKNIHRGKKIVLIGAGPSLRSFRPIKDAIYIGVNSTFLYEKIKLNYLFIQDFLSAEGMQAQANIYQGNDCKKFYGMHYLVPPLSQDDYEVAKAEPFYFIAQSVPTPSLATFSADITTRPLNTWASIIFPALEFALWTNPAELYIVGCDCANNGYFHSQKNALYVNEVIYGWQTMKTFIIHHYPQLSVYSINPVGLRGMFTDINYDTLS